MEWFFRTFPFLFLCFLLRNRTPSFLLLFVNVRRKHRRLSGAHEWACYTVSAVIPYVVRYSSILKCESYDLKRISPYLHLQPSEGTIKGLINQKKISFISWARRSFFVIVLIFCPLPWLTFKGYKRSKNSFGKLHLYLHLSSFYYKKPQSVPIQLFLLSLVSQLIPGIFVRTPTNSFEFYPFTQELGKFEFVLPY